MLPNAVKVASLQQASIVGFDSLEHLFQVMSQYIVLALLLVAVQNVHSKDWQSTKRTSLARNLYLLNNTVMSDIKFTFEESRRKWFYAHKHILATRSTAFYKMFYEATHAKNLSAVHLPEADAESLMEFLRFLYTDECTMTPQIALKLTKLAQRFIIPSLEQACVEVLHVNTTAENAFALLEETQRLENQELQEKYWNVIDTHTSKALASKNFISISRTTLINLLKRDTLRIGEVELLKAVLRWSDHQCSKANLTNTRENKRQVLGEAVYELRFLLMSKEEFAQNVPSVDLLTNDEIVPIYQKLMGLKSENLRWSVNQTRSDYMRFPRFSQADINAPDLSWLTYLFPTLFSKNSDDILWYRWGKPAFLCFSVNKAAMLYGIRLFGDGKGGKYEVNVEVKGVQIRGTYTSEFVLPVGQTSSMDGVELFNFEVVFPTPILIKPYEDIDISVDARGPRSFFGTNEKTSVTNRDLTIYFADTKSYYFYVKHRQIYEIILIPVKK